MVDNLGTVLGTVGSGASLNSNVGFNPTQLLTTAGKIAGSTTDPTGFASAANGAKFGFVANNVTGFVQALETIGSTKILASPRILVLNKQRAEIQLGTRLGFQTFSQNFTSTIQQVQFLNTGTLLRIRPFISEDGMVRMEIHPERSSGYGHEQHPQPADGRADDKRDGPGRSDTGHRRPDGRRGRLLDPRVCRASPGSRRWAILFGSRQKNEGRRELVVLLDATHLVRRPDSPAAPEHGHANTRWRQRRSGSCNAMRPIKCRPMRRLPIRDRLDGCC